MTSPLDNKLFFSNELKYRLGRHLLFWLCYWLYFGLLHAVNSWGNPENMYLRNLPFTLMESILLIIPQVLMTYPMLYFILPRVFLKKKYLLGFMLTAVLFMIGSSISLYMVFNVHEQVLGNILPSKYMRAVQRPENVSFVMGLFAIMKGGLLCVTTAVGLSLMKQWYFKENRNLLLQKENNEAQLRLLTAQIHPHFLFNTLNNIFSQTQTESPKGSTMIMGLSDLLRYILYEGQKILVPLEQELQMIREYISLEKIRYGNKLDVHVLTPDKIDEIYIAPLLLLPFIENCFKHGTSQILEHPWINLTVELKNDVLVMKLMNGKAIIVENEKSKPPGIGITNVRKRLEFLYRGKHELQIREQDEVFVVDLRVELVRLSNIVNTQSTMMLTTETAYV